MDEMTEDKREVCSKCQKMYEVTQKKCKKCHGPLFLVEGEALIPYKIFRLKKVAKVLSVISIIWLVLYGFWYSSFNIQRQAIFYPSRKESNVWVYSFGDKYGLATPDQKMITRPFMQQIYTFSDKGLALYSLEEQKDRSLEADTNGIINTSGEIIMQPSFKDYLYDRTRYGESVIEHGLIYQDVNGEKSSVINSEGEVILKDFGYIDYREIYVDSFPKKIFPYRIDSKDELVGLISFTGESVKEPFAPTFRSMNI